MATSSPTSAPVSSAGWGLRRGGRWGAGGGVGAAARLLIHVLVSLQTSALATKQNAERLGHAISAIGELVGDGPIDKMSFSSCASPAFLEPINRTHRRTWLLCGVES